MIKSSLPRYIGNISNPPGRPFSTNIMTSLAFGKIDNTNNIPKITILAPKTPSANVQTDCEKLNLQFFKLGDSVINFNNVSRIEKSGIFFHKIKIVMGSGFFPDKQSFIFFSRQHRDESFDNLLKKIQIVDLF